MRRNGRFVTLSTTIQQKNLLQTAHNLENVLQYIYLYYNILQPIAVDLVDFFMFFSRARDSKSGPTLREWRAGAQTVNSVLMLSNNKN